MGPDRDKPSAAPPSRRQVLVGAAGLTLQFGRALPAGASSRTADAVEFAPWVTIGVDGIVSIMSPANEMGQGTKTSLPLILAEEMDADWAKVRIVFAPPSDALYGNPGFLGMMYTAGSTAVIGYFAPLRRFGAQVRRILLDNVAREWGVPPTELATSAGEVLHVPSGRRIGYGQVAAFAVMPERAPEIRDEELKKPADFRLIGKDVMRFDVPSKVDGSARYSIDVQVPGMAYGAVLHPPVAGSRPVKVDGAAAKAVPDVLGVHEIPTGVAVLATTAWGAFAGKDALAVQWSAVEASTFESEAAMERYAAVAAGSDRRAPAIWDKVGDAEGTIGRSSKVVAGEYMCDYAYHAQMEPLNAVASVAPDGASAELWCGTQSQTMAVATAAQVLGLPPDRIKLHDMLLGGGFGRRGPRDEDFILDALHLSKASRRPVKVIWRREEDLRNGRFRPMSAHRLRAALAESGAVEAWHHRVATDNVGVFQDPVRYYGPWKERDMISLAGTELPTYSIPNRLAEHFALDSGIRVSALRGIGFTANKFATESFVDELSRQAGVSPLSFRLGRGLVTC